MKTESKKVRNAILISKIILAFFLIVSIYISIKYRGQIWELIKDKDALRDWIESYGVYAPIAFILIQILQVVIFYIPGEVTQIAGGYVFGTWDGLIYSTVGITIGSIMAFGIGRLFGRPFFEHIVSKEWLEKFDRVMHSKRYVLLLFILFLVPGAPKDMLCYIAGLTNMSFALFVLVSTPARMPNLVLSTIFGATLADEDYVWSLIIVGLTLLLMLLGYLIKKKFHIMKHETHVRK